MDDYRTRALASGRRKGAVGTKPTAVTKYVLNNVPKTKGVLDYGAGKFLQQTKILESAGYTVFAHDLEENMAEWEPSYRVDFCGYDVILLSNVINMLVHPLWNLGDYIYQHAAADGKVIFNMPKEPNISNITIDEVIDVLLESRFFVISNINNNVYVAHRVPKKGWEKPTGQSTVERMKESRKNQLAGGYLK